MVVHSLQLLREGGNDENTRINNKKKRRLDKYIEAKLRKEEKARLLEKLAHSSADIRDRTELVSAATLGTGRAAREAERVQKILGASSSSKRGAFQVDEDDEDEDLDAAPETEELDRELVEDSEQPELPTQEEADARHSRIVEAARRFDPPAAQPAPTVTPAVGSALAMGPDGQPLAPIVRKRKRTGPQSKVNMSVQDRIRYGRMGKTQSSDSGGDESADGSSDNSDDSDDDSDDGDEDVHVYDVDKAIEESRKRVAAERAWKRPENDEAMDSDDSVATDELVSEEEDTDEEEEAVLLHAMRLRGMLPDDTAPKASASKGKKKAVDSDSDEESTEQSGDDSESDDEGEDEDDEDEDDEEGQEAADTDEDEDDDEDEYDDEDENEDEDAEESGDTDETAQADAPQSKRWGLGESARTKAFKQWAMEAMHLARPDFDTDGHELQPVGGHVVRVRDLGPQDGKARGPLGRDVASPASKSSFAKRFFDEEAHFRATKAPVRHVPVQRDETLQAARMALPVVAEEDLVVRTINENPVTVLCGETGSGKTTQIPQFLYEAAYATAGSGTSPCTYAANPGMIGVTQPRRVAAVSMAKRVAHELGLDSHRVAHQIRYDATTGPHTQIKFMTDGVLLRELAQDLLLTKYSVIVVDEAHERSVNTDVLIGMLSRVVRLREQRWASGELGLASPRPLRLVIMSATLRVGDFTQNTTLFPTPPPLIQIGARQHPVAIHFNRRTVQDYVTEAIKKASKIHARLPHGGILIFVTGQQEVMTVCRKLQQRYGADALARKAAQRMPTRTQALSARDVALEAEDVELGTDALPAVDEPEDVEADPDALDTDDEDDDEEADDELGTLEPSSTPMHILPLYSLLPNEEQQRVFEDPPENTRLVVVATNVAETSITIPNIKYVVDTGRAKERHLDPRSQVQSYNITWISKASAAQRAGRAGRTGPGHCYRLYSSAVYEEVFPPFSVPEILRTPVEGLVLQMKAMNIDNVANFPFPTPPERDALRRAERTLVHLGALEAAEARRAGGRRDLHASITALGRVMALFPVLPRYAKLLAQGNQQGCLPYAAALVAALSVGDVFEREDRTPDVPPDMDPAEAKEVRRKARAAYYGAMRIFDALGEGQSDAFLLLSVVGAYAHEAAHGAASAFCQSHFVRRKAMEEIHQLRAQLGQIMLANLSGISDAEERRLLDPSLAPPSAVQCKVLRQFLTAIYIDRVAVRADVVGAPEAENTPAARGSKLASTRHVPYVALGVQGPVYIHMSSTFFHRPPPEWVVFGELHQSAPKHAVADDEEVPVPKVWLKLLTRINPAWLPKLGRTLCTFSQPTEAQPSATLGKLAASMRDRKKGSSEVLERDVLLTPRYGGAMEDGGVGQGLGWELPAVTAKQRYEQGRWVTQP